MLVPVLIVLVRAALALSLILDAHRLIKVHSVAIVESIRRSRVTFSLGKPLISCSLDCGTLLKLDLRLVTKSWKLSLSTLLVSIILCLLYLPVVFGLRLRPNSKELVSCVL